MSTEGGSLAQKCFRVLISSLLLPPASVSSSSSSSPLLPSSTLPSFSSPPPATSNILLLVYGELERGPRPANSTSIASHVVAPLVKQRRETHAEVSVVVSAQCFRPRLHIEKNRNRWEGLMPYTQDEQEKARLDTIDAFLSAGARRVFYQYHCSRDDTKASAFSGESLHYGGVLTGTRASDGMCLRPPCLKVHDAPSARAHLFARHTAYRDLQAAERAWGVAAARSPNLPFFRWVILVRNDAFWIRDILPSLPDSLPSTNHVATKDCLEWGGLNDKFAILPRQKTLEIWMDTSHALSSLNYSSVESLLLAIAMQNDVPIARLSPSDLPFVDHYSWRGCFPSKYAHSGRSIKECSRGSKLTIRCNPRAPSRVAILQGSGPSVCGSCACLPPGLCENINADICPTMAAGVFGNRKKSGAHYVDCHRTSFQR